MLCYECNQAGQRSEAVGLCHHCSAALCPNHAHSVKDPVETVYPLGAVVVLPLRARLILCETCLSALRQTREPH
jgi:hypothetical protein